MSRPTPYLTLTLIDKQTIMEPGNFEHRYEAHSSDCFCLLYTIQGNAVLTYNKQDILLSPRTLVFLPEFSSKYIRLVKGNWEYCMILFTGSAASYFYESYTALPELLIEIPDSSGLEHTLNYACEHPVSGASSELLNIQFLTDILVRTILHKKELCQMEKMVPSYLNSIKKLFDTKYQDYYSLDSLEKQFDVNKFRLAKEFTHYYGIAPISYLNRKRIQIALSLLTSTQDHVNEIGRQVGMENTNHFIRTFKKQTGTTPRLYRMQHSSARLYPMFVTTTPSV